MAGTPEAAPEGQERDAYPRPKANLALLQRFHDEVEGDLGSLNSRAGVALGAVVAVIVASGSQLPLAEPAHAGSRWLLRGYAASAAGGLIALLVGGAYFCAAMISGYMKSAYDVPELQSPPSEHWEEDVFVFRQIDLTTKAIHLRREALASKGRRFNRGLWWAGGGFAAITLTGLASLLPLG